MDNQLLANIPLFSKLSPEQLQDLGALLKTVRVEAQQPIFWIGDVGNDFFIVQHGNVGLTYPDENGKEMVLASLGPGQFFGEISLLDDGPRTATARAQSDCTLLALGRAQFLQFLQRHQTASVLIISVLGHRQRETLERLRGVTNANVVSDETLTPGQRIADGFASVMGSWPFIIVQSVILLCWVTLNVMAWVQRWDPYPFILLNLALSFQAAYSAPIIMMSQNRQGTKDRIKADLDYQVNLKAQYEIMQLHQKLDRLERSMGGARPLSAATNGSR